MIAPTICCPVWGDKAPSWEYWMVKSLKLAYRHALVYRRIWPESNMMTAMFGDMAHRLTSGYLKARAWADFAKPQKSYEVAPGWIAHKESLTSPMWILDADLLLLRPLSWCPESEETIMAAAPGGDVKYLDFARKAGFEPVDETTINVGVLWVYGDISPLWVKWWEPVLAVMRDSPYPISECIFNIIWHHLRKEGKAELLPVSYNQIISEHGPYGATIFHLAGAPEHFKAQLMESYYKALVSPEV